MFWRGIIIDRRTPLVSIAIIGHRCVKQILQPTLNILMISPFCHEYFLRFLQQIVIWRDCPVQSPGMDSIE